MIIKGTILINIIKKIFVKILWDRNLVNIAESINAENIALIMEMSNVPTNCFCISDPIQFSRLLPDH